MLMSAKKVAKMIIIIGIVMIVAGFTSNKLAENAVDPRLPRPNPYLVPTALIGIFGIPILASGGLTYFIIRRKESKI